MFAEKAANDGEHYARLGDGPAISGMCRHGPV
jgi:hypothetical protein